MSSSISSDQPPPLPLLILLGSLIAGIELFLFSAIPYSYGYAKQRLPLQTTTFDFWSHADWQHCWLVLPLALFMAWQKRHLLKSLPLTHSLWGILPLLGGLFLYWAGYRTDNYLVGLSALWMLLLGTMAWLLGWRWIQTLFFPLCFLLFAFPLFFLDSFLALPLRFLATALSTALLNTLHIPVVQQGTAILSAPNPQLYLATGSLFSIDVADPCSGIRSLFALFLLSTLYSYFFIKPFWKQAMICLSTFPLAILGNIVRILMLTLGTLTLGPSVAIGSLEHPSIFHLFAGFLVFFVAVIGLILFSQLLARDPWVLLYQRLKQLWHEGKTSTTTTELENQPTAPQQNAESEHSDLY